MKVVCFHLYNDFSGSPKVLRMVLEGLTAKNIHVELVTSRGRGALSELSKYGVRIFTYPYRFSQNPVLTMIQYVGVQFYLFFLPFDTLLVDKRYSILILFFPLELLSQGD